MIGSRWALGQSNLWKIYIVLHSLVQVFVFVFEEFE